MAKVLVIGGAGYIGSTAAAYLLDHGHEVTVLDNLSTGHRELVLTPRFVLAESGDVRALDHLLGSQSFDCVMHFAALSIVGESVQNPDRYFENNVAQTRLLLECLLKHGIKRLVYSSSAAVYGNVGSALIDESSLKAPINPYGQNKLEVERHLEALAERAGLQAIALRYFNAAGAEEKLRVGEWHDQESHLIPKLLSSVIHSKPFQLFGHDYPTPDGTCIRDYVHVSDLAVAHAAAMDRLLALPTERGFFRAYNLGSGRGYSVAEIIRATEAVVGHRLEVERCPRRAGDPAHLVAKIDLARKELGIDPSTRSLAEIVSSAWAWEKKRAIPRRAVFLDRDGTLNDDPGYLSQPEQLKLFPGIGNSLRRLREAGFVLVVVSNQSGVGWDPLESTCRHASLSIL